MRIFRDTQDYSVFLSYLKTYLLPKDEKEILIKTLDANQSSKSRETLLKLAGLENFYGRISLICYCLMPNHYHLLIHQKNRNDLTGFMRSLMTRYTQYFNKKHKRKGPLYEGRYKAVIIETDEQLWHLTRYIHRNPLGLLSNEISKIDIIRLLTSQPSSYPVFIKHIKQEWVSPNKVLDNFAISGKNSYQSFIEDFDSSLEERTMRTVYKIALDFEL